MQTALHPPNLPLPSQGEEQGVAILPLHGDLPIDQQSLVLQPDPQGRRRIILATNVADSSVRSEEHTSELQSLMRHSDAVFCLKKKKHKSSQQCENRLST